eukprot:CAMPEP_0119016840 /NCGR_PEP_ID=MMETSP1176-20130426/14596_1 /TAXON_ID=265551 /ORGANISM="Synedropsis recta cf, Strain CCMP1620" /LENGTH=462 /DNA_ID=CAMNT_0006970387 /DNA_START=141 /DNA_END=1529 /DNA_ORIENTATION=-
MLRGGQRPGPRPRGGTIINRQRTFLNLVLTPSVVLILVFSLRLLLFPSTTTTISSRGEVETIQPNDIVRWNDREEQVTTFVAPQPLLPQQQQTTRLSYPNKNNATTTNDALVGGDSEKTSSSKILATTTTTTSSSESQTKKSDASTPDVKTGSSSIVSTIIAADGNSNKALSQQIPTVVITGLVKNAAPHLRKLEAVIRRVVAKDFRLAGIIFYENDSTDKTLEILNSWKWADGLLTIISETNVTIPQRTDRIAHGRNLILSQLLTMPADTVDYMLMMDMDEVNYHLSHVNECLNLPPGFGVCCANQYKVYYDLWALRTYDLWLPFDMWKSPLSMRVVVNQKYRHIPASADPISVKSCFGGAALYNVSLLRQIPAVDTLYTGTQYDTIHQKPYIACEHAPFHEAILKHLPDFKLLIQPKMLNDGPSDEFKPIMRARKKRETEWNQSYHDPLIKRYYDARYGG